MQVYHLDSLSSKELYKNVIVRLIHGNELTFNYFELKNREVKIQLHEHPVEHIVIILEGELQFIFEEKKINLKKKDCFFVPPKKKHKAIVIDSPVKALEIYKITKDEYYNK